MKAILKNCILFAAVVFLFTGCAIITNGISYQKDRLMGTSRYTWHETFTTNQLHEQQYEQDISILKEIDARQQVTYTMYDIISLPMKSFDVSNEMYIIIDNEVIPLSITLKERLYDGNYGNKSNFPQQNPPAETAYDLTNSKVTRMIHPLSDEMIELITTARRVYLRYYVGPNMITSEIKGAKLYSVKKLISRK